MGDGRDNQNDGDHDQEFNQRESLLALTHFLFSSGFSSFEISPLRIALQRDFIVAEAGENPMEHRLQFRSYPCPMAKAPFRRTLDLVL